MFSRRQPGVYEMAFALSSTLEIGAGHRAGFSLAQPAFGKYRVPRSSRLDSFLTSPTPFLSPN